MKPRSARYVRRWAALHMRKSFALIATLFLVACGVQSEDALRQQFTEYKSTIRQILEMQDQDTKVVRIAPTFTRLENDWSWPRKDIGFSAERWDRYKSLFEKAHITDGIQKDGKYVWYFVSSKGLSIGGTSRGFVYTKISPQPLVRRFEDCPNPERICYIALEENWYLFEWVT